MRNIRKIMLTLTTLAIAAQAPFAMAAARFNFDNPVTVKAQTQFTVRVIVSPDDTIDAIEGAIQYDPAFLAVQSVSDAGSIVSLWMDAPKASAGKVSYAGIIPGGIGPVGENKNKLIDIVFSALKTGTTRVAFSPQNVYLNGQASVSSALTARDATIVISETAGEGAQVTPVKDNMPPIPFEVYISGEPLVFMGDHFLIFNTQDKESGINHYEVREMFLGLFGRWKAATSPYHLEHQTLVSIIRVRAVDNAGNIRVKTVVPWQLPAFYLILFVMLGSFLRWYLSGRAATS